MIDLARYNSFSDPIHIFNESTTQMMENSGSLLKWIRVSKYVKEDKKFYIFPLPKKESQICHGPTEDGIIVYELEDKFHKQVLEIDPDYKLEFSNKCYINGVIKHLEVRISGSKELETYITLIL